MLRAAIVLGMLCPLLHAQEDWRARVQQAIAEHRWVEALEVTEARLSDVPGDAEAHGERARLLAWSGRWSEAEAEYRWVLARSPDDVDILTGLADVFVWQGRHEEALQVLNEAAAHSRSAEVLLRRGKALEALQRRAEAGDDFRAVLALAPANREARAHLAGLLAYRHELRFGAGADAYNRSDAAGLQTLAVRSRWSPQWATEFSFAAHQRFGAQVQRVGAQVDRRLGANWISVAAVQSSSGSVLARREASGEFGRAFRLAGRFILGLESSGQQRWLWFDGARVMVLSTSQLLYLPHDWTFLLTVRGARSSFDGAGSEWQPSGSVRLGFPLHRSLQGHLDFGVGAENFSQAEQVGHFAARDFGGGFKARLSPAQEIALYVSRQLRSRGATQTSFGVTYAIRF